MCGPPPPFLNSNHIAGKLIICQLCNEWYTIWNVCLCIYEKKKNNCRMMLSISVKPAANIQQRKEKNQIFLKNHIRMRQNSFLCHSTQNVVHFQSIYGRKMKRTSTKRHSYRIDVLFHLDVLVKMGHFKLFARAFCPWHT